MSRHFVALVEPFASEKERKFIDFLKARKLAWWHRIDGSWLIVNSAEDISAQDIRTALKDASGLGELLVLRVEPTGYWAGTGPSQANMFSWIKKHWVPSTS